MRRFAAEGRAFLVSFVESWVGLMSGICGVVLWATAAAAEPLPLSARLTLFVFGTAAAIAASFLVWRKAYREARPYDEETYQHSRQIFAALPDEEKTLLERIAIEKSVYQWSELHPSGLLEAGFISVDPADCKYRLHPDYALIVPRLLKAWRAART